MTPERQQELRNNPHARLTLDELRDGWHFCDEFDNLLTQGEILHADGVTCVCGFNPRELERFLSGVVKP